MPRPHKRVPLRIIYGFRSGSFSFADRDIRGYVLENMTRALPFDDARSLFGIEPAASYEVEPLSKLARSLVAAGAFEKARVQWFDTPMKAYAPGSQREYQVLAVDTVIALANALVNAAARKLLSEVALPAARRAAVILAASGERDLVHRIDAHAGYQRAEIPALEWVGEATQPRGDAFPEAFFRAVAKTRGENVYEADSRPSYWGWIIRNTVYQRLGPGVYEAMKDAASRSESRRHKTRLYQHLSDAGRDAMDAQVLHVIETAKKARDYEHLLELLDQTTPRYT